MRRNRNPLEAADSRWPAIAPVPACEWRWSRIIRPDLRGTCQLSRHFPRRSWRWIVSLHFRAYDQWGEGVLEKTGHMKPPSVRLSDERCSRPIGERVSQSPTGRD